MVHVLDSVVADVNGAQMSAAWNRKQICSAYFNYPEAATYFVTRFWT